MISVSSLSVEPSSPLTAGGPRVGVLGPQVAHTLPLSLQNESYLGCQGVPSRLGGQLQVHLGHLWLLAHLGRKTCTFDGGDPRGQQKLGIPCCEKSRYNTGLLPCSSLNHPVYIPSCRTVLPIPIHILIHTHTLQHTLTFRNMHMESPKQTLPPKCIFTYEHLLKHTSTQFHTDTYIYSNHIDNCIHTLIYTYWLVQTNVHTYTLSLICHTHRSLHASPLVCPCFLHFQALYLNLYQEETGWYLNKFNIHMGMCSDK